MAFRRIRRLDLQAKISLVLIGVVLPTFVLVTVLQNHFTQVVLEQEIKQLGLASAKTLAREIVRQKYLKSENPGRRIESYLQEYLYTQPNIMRMDVLVPDSKSGAAQLIASNIEEEPGATPQNLILVEREVTSFRFDEDLGLGMWEILVPIELRPKDPNGIRKVVGTVHAVVSTRQISQIIGPLWRISVLGGMVSVMILIVVLSYFLRKTIENDRKLKRAENENIELTEQLHEAQRQLMNNEKFAVMGQLTASFAHEIGTPLNAIGGHLHLLREEVAPHLPVAERLDTIDSQVQRIASIVKNFLQSTSQPVPQRQWVDVNRVAEQALSWVRPSTEALDVEVTRLFNRSMGPVRIVPLDLEQVVLNLVNNSLDSLRAKREAKKSVRAKLEIVTDVIKEAGRTWAILEVFDTGSGISKVDLESVTKPFYTTKRPGEGTGLGLTICQDMARKYGGDLQIKSREGAWTRITLRIPYQEMQ